MYVAELSGSQSLYSRDASVNDRLTVIVIHVHVTQVSCKVRLPFVRSCCKTENRKKTGQLYLDWFTSRQCLQPFSKSHNDKVTL